MSTNWKDIGMNSGNMRNHRNVTSNKLNYETGKWDSIYEVSGIEMKGYTFDICGQNVVVGIGTEKPFSRLSLGNNDNDGEFNANKPGQLAGIGIHEESNGANFSGLFYNTDISGQKKNVRLIPGLQIMSSTTDFSLNDTANTGKIIIGSDNVVTIAINDNLKNLFEKIARTNCNSHLFVGVFTSSRSAGYHIICFLQCAIASTIIIKTFKSNVPQCTV